jgi:hypothetical protein
MIAAAASPASVTEALGMLTSAMGYLAAADATQMPASVQAECLAGLEQVDAIETAARASILAGFTAGKGYIEDGDYSPRAWLIHQTRITTGAAAGHVAWVRRTRAHPRIAAALAAGEISEPYARTLCGWTGKLPEGCRDDADAILVGAAIKGMDLRDLAMLAAEIQSRAQPAPDDGDSGQDFEDRAVRLETTFEGAGVLSGNLSAECAAVLATVLEALSAPQGVEDTRNHEQRYHDGLQEAMRRLVAAGLLPERAGQPSKVVAHIPLCDLIELDADSALLRQWTERARSRWAAYRAAASVAGGDGAAWLDGEDAEAFSCDASWTPVVTGEVNPAVLEDLVRLCVQLARYHHPDPAPDPASPGNSVSSGDPAGPDGPAPADAAPAPGIPLTSPDSQVPAGLLSREALERAVIGKAVALLSGPGGLAGFLRREQLGARLAGPSLPLDVGFSKDIPASIRNAVRIRDLFCQWPGGCHQPASGCEVHHIKHKARGGVTSVDNCILLCSFHHNVMIHRLGWTLVRHPDGTTMAWNRDRTKTLRSHSPPARAG